MSVFALFTNRDVSFQPIIDNWELTPVSDAYLAPSASLDGTDCKAGYEVRLLLSCTTL